MTEREVIDLFTFANREVPHLAIKPSDTDFQVKRKLEILKAVKKAHEDGVYEVAEHMTSSVNLILDEDNPKFCPICGEKYQASARCPRSERYCKNGHTWHICTVHKKIVIGHSNNTIPMFDCSCVH